VRPEHDATNPRRFQLQWINEQLLVDSLRMRVDLGWMVGLL
jgi:hypothetical protein